MKMHVEKMTSEVAVFEGELPLSEKQTAALVKKVMAALAEKKREQAMAQEATELRSGATPRLEVG